MKPTTTLQYIVFMLLFFGCKKYPENNLWFKNPKKQPIIWGFITKYEVNGIDSLDLLNHYIKPTLTDRNIRNARFNYSIEHGIIRTSWNFTGCSDAVTYSFFDNNNKIFINYTPDCIKRNIFLMEEWTILHFPTKRQPFLKLQTTTPNRNKYEIRFN